MKYQEGNRNPSTHSTRKTNETAEELPYSKFIPYCLSPQARQQDWPEWLLSWLCTHILLLLLGNRKQNLGHSHAMTILSGESVGVVCSAEENYIFWQTSPVTPPVRKSKGTHPQIHFSRILNQAEPISPIHAMQWHLRQSSWLNFLSMKSTKLRQKAKIK